jgi:hypothetical protein
MISALTPQDLRAEDPRPRERQEDQRSTVAAAVRRRLGDTCDDIIDALGLAVTS